MSWMILLYPRRRGLLLAWAMIQLSDLPMTVLAKRLDVTVETIARWKQRDSVEDRSHTSHRLQTTLSPEQEAIVLVLRKTLDLSLNDLLAVVHEFSHPTITRSALHRMLKRHSVSKREPADGIRPFTFTDLYGSTIALTGLARLQPTLASSQGGRYRFGLDVAHHQSPLVTPAPAQLTRPPAPRRLPPWWRRS
jgi:hypothetical protein